MKKHIIFLFLLYSHTLSAQDINSVIDNTEANYASLPVYLDSGKVVSSFYNMPKPFSSGLLFKTAYKKTGEYNFEFHNMGNDRLHIVNRDNNGKVSVWSGATASNITDKSFSLALAGATGISSNAVGIITDLLIPGVRHARTKNIFYTLTDAKLESSEVIDGRPCFKLKGQNKIGDGYTIIWISKSDHLIRKVENDHGVGTFRVKATYTFTPYTLKTANNSLFAFRPGRRVEL